MHDTCDWLNSVMSARDVVKPEVEYGICWMEEGWRCHPSATTRLPVCSTRLPLQRLWHLDRVGRSVVSVSLSPGFYFNCPLGHAYGRLPR